MHLLLFAAVSQQQRTTRINTGEPRSKTVKGLYTARCARDDVILSIIKRIICTRSHCSVPCASSHTGNLGMHRMHEFMIARKSGMFGTEWYDGNEIEFPRETNFMERLQPTPRKYRCGFLKLEVTRRGIFSRVRFSATRWRSATGKHF